MTELPRATSLDELRQAVIDLRRVRVRAGGSKSAWSADATLDVSGMSGILEYDPHEYTLTALAGTPLREVQQLLQAKGQFLPFDPPLAGAGATLGGTVAAGLSGPGRLRFGGIRDFLLGVRLVTGEGRIVFGGGKVVKNAAGFDIPKLMVGAGGAYGVLAELTFKVFPLPETYATLLVPTASVEQALQIQAAVVASPLEPACLDWQPPDQLLVRVGGRKSAIAARLQRLQSLCSGGQVVQDSDEEQLWNAAREMQWRREGDSLLRISLTPQQIIELEGLLAPLDCPRRYSVAGNQLLLSWPAAESMAPLEQWCRAHQQVAAVFCGDGHCRQLGDAPGSGLRRRLLTVFDPQGKFATEQLV